MTITRHAAACASQANWNSRFPQPLSLPVPVALLDDVVRVLSLSLHRVRSSSDGSAYCSRIAEEIERVMADVRQCQEEATLPVPGRERGVIAVATSTETEADAGQTG
jgi:hypothetical protein